MSDSNKTSSKVVSGAILEAKRELLLRERELGMQHLRELEMRKAELQAVIGRIDGALALLGELVQVVVEMPQVA